MVVGGWSIALMFIGWISASFGFCWLVHRTASEGDRRLHDRIDMEAERAAAFREHVGKEFVRRSDAADQESRLEKKFDQMGAQIDRMDRKFDAMAARMTRGV